MRSENILLTPQNQRQHAQMMAYMWTKEEGLLSEVEVEDLISLEVASNQTEAEEELKAVLILEGNLRNSLNSKILTMISKKSKRNPKINNLKG